jgi:hypothetical protein
VAIQTENIQTVRVTPGVLGPLTWTLRHAHFLTRAAQTDDVTHFPSAEMSRASIRTKTPAPGADSKPLLKLDLAAQDWADMDAYAEVKSEVVGAGV